MNKTLSSPCVEKRLSRKAGRMFNVAFEVLESRNLLSNTAPVANPDYYSANKNTALTIKPEDPNDPEGTYKGVLSNDTDAEHDAMTATLDTTIINGTLDLNPDGTFTYTPNTDFTGYDYFYYTAGDGHLSSLSTQVVIFVNNAPVGADTTYSVDQNQILTIDATEGLMGGVTDPDLSADQITQYVTCVYVDAPLNGKLDDDPSGSFKYTPYHNFFGTDTFTYHFYDTMGYSQTYTATITVNHINQAPTAVDDTYSVSVASGETYAINPSGVMSNDTDPDKGDSKTCTQLTNTAHGDCKIDPDGGFTYTPNPGFHGQDFATYLFSDGYVDSNIATITFNVNHKAIGHDESYSTFEDTPLSVVARGVLLNCVDPDSENMTAVLKNDASHGHVVLNSDGSFLYTPDADYNGLDTFVYAPNDGIEDGISATVTISISAVNDAPVAADDAWSLRPDTTLSLNAANGVIKNDKDVDHDPMTATLLSNVTKGTLVFNADGSFVYTPNAGYHGTDSFSYQISDGLLTDTAVVVLNITRPPVPADDAYQLSEDQTLHVPARGVLENDTDPDSDTLSAVVTTLPSHGTLTLNSDGSFDYTPELDYNGTDSFAYRANDSMDGDSIATVNLVILPVNDAPVAVDVTFSTLEDVVLTVVADADPGLRSNNSDVDNDKATLTVHKLDGPNDGPYHGKVTNFTSDGSFTYTPDTDYNGTDTFTYQLYDGSLYSAIKTVTINIQEDNDPPVAQPDSNNIRQGSTLTVAAPGVLSNDTDPDSAYRTSFLTPDGNVKHGTLDFHSDGSYVYTPNPDFSGEDTFSYYAFDSFLNSNTVTVTITVSEYVNHAPTAKATTLDHALNATSMIINLDSLNLIADTDGDKLKRKIKVAPKYGTALLDNNGTVDKTYDDFIVYYPKKGYFGYDTLTYSVDDSRGGVTSAKITIRITPASLVKSGKLYNLYVVGTTGNDSIKLETNSKTKVKVSINGTSQGIFSPTGSILVYGLEGNDTITGKGLAKSIKFYGGAGNDKITGSAKTSYLYGEDGNDTLYGGTSGDVLTGGGGKNVLKKSSVRSR